MKKILIADDSFYQRKVLGDMATDLGYSFDQVASGEELLEVLDETIDCIFLDLLMTGISGIEVLEKLRERSDVPPIIIISADVQKARKDECMELGAAAFINKSVSKEELENALNDILK